MGEVTLSRPQCLSRPTQWVEEDLGKRAHFTMMSIRSGETKQQCRHCGHPLLPEAAYCPACHRAAASGADEQPSAGDEVYLMLVTANVLRLRRQYELAEAQCGEVLRRHPRNATAHSVMGDIARDRGNYRDAIEWYKMTLDLAPDSMADRKKLEAVIDRVYPRDGRSMINRLRADVSGSLGSAAAEMRAARIPSAVSIMLIAMVAVIVLVTIAVLVLGRGGMVAPEPAAAEPSSGAFAPPPVGSLEPRPVDPAAGVSAMAARFGAEVPSVEVALLEGLREQARTVDPNCEVREVKIDPLDGVATIELSMPRLWSAENTRNTILRVAAPLAAVAAEWDRRISQVRVRCAVRQAGEPPQLGLVAQAGPARAADVLRESGVRGPEEAFAQIWWHPELAPEPEAPPYRGAR